jgi:hypothetical protein
VVRPQAERLGLKLAPYVRSSFDHSEPFVGPAGSAPNHLLYWTPERSQQRRLHVPMHSKWATRRYAVAAALAPRLKGLNITADLMQVGKVVTGEQSHHHGQGLRAPFIVLPAALQVLR